MSRENKNEDFDTVLSDAQLVEFVLLVSQWHKEKIKLGEPLVAPEEYEKGVAIELPDGHVIRYEGDNAKAFREGFAFCLQMFSELPFTVEDPDQSDEDNERDSRGLKSENSLH